MTHTEKVANISGQIRELSGKAHAVKLAKKEVSHFVPNPYDKSGKLPKLDIKALNEIIEIDAAKKTCVAEPGVSFGMLVRETLKHGLIPSTVPELKGITIGGAVSGCSVESMSYRLGGFHDSCLEYEAVTGTGDIIKCSDSENSDIFHMLHGSYGTLGIITSLKFKLLPAKPFVKMTYVKFDSFEEFWASLKDECLKGRYDFIDAIIHGPESFVACMGKMVDEAPYVSSYKWLNIFYKSTAERDEDYLTISDYFFRYDTECHWLTKTVPLMETKPARFLLGKAVLGSTNLIKWSKRLKSVMRLKKRPEVVVDVFIPSGRFGDFFKWYKDAFKFYPLWIVPYRSPQVYPWIDADYAKKMEGAFFIDCAVYGKPNSEKGVDYSEVLEKKTFELNGIKTLISRNHFNEATFWNVYSRKNYEAVKKVTDPNGLFKGLYEKFRPENYR